MLLELVRRISLVLLAAAIVTGAGSAMTATNTVPASHLQFYSASLTPNAPSLLACSGATLSMPASGTGLVGGGSIAAGIPMQGCTVPLP